MTYAGARGDTAKDMAKTLHFTLEPERLHPAFSGLLWQLQGEGKPRGYRLNVANALWGKEEFREGFLTVNRDNYAAGLRQLDLGNTKAAAETINAWVEKETRGKIKDLLQPDDLNNAALILTNAIYFKGDWDSKFNARWTTPEAFHRTARDKVDVPLMYQTKKFFYFDDGKAGTFQLLELPYKGRDLAMVVLLPRWVDGLAGLEKALTADNLARWLRKMHSREVAVTLPKFKLAGATIKLNEPLRALGMGRAFTPGKADFSGTAGAPGELFISSVLHKAFVGVNEEGTEATAVTAVKDEKSADKSVDKDEKKRVIFRADHPFLFLIRDTRSGSILFMGRVRNPA
jgi:serpin B